MMTILRWVILAALAVAFLLMSVANWVAVPFQMPDGAEINAPLPLLLGGAFLLGWLPTWLLHLGTRTTLKRRIAKIERVGDEGKAPVPQPLPSQAQPIAAQLPSQAQPTIVPPAGA